MRLLCGGERPEGAMQWWSVCNDVHEVKSSPAPLHTGVEDSAKVEDSVSCTFGG
jgi:hypothetical protein